MDFILADSVRSLVEQIKVAYCDSRGFISALPFDGYLGQPMQKCIFRGENNYQTSPLVTTRDSVKNIVEPLVMCRDALNDKKGFDNIYSFSTSLAIALFKYHRPYLRGTSCTLNTYVICLMLDGGFECFICVPICSLFNADVWYRILTMTYPPHVLNGHYIVDYSIDAFCIDFSNFEKLSLSQFLRSYAELNGKGVNVYAAPWFDREIIIGAIKNQPLQTWNFWDTALVDDLRYLYLLWLYNQESLFCAFYTKLTLQWPEYDLSFFVKILVYLDKGLEMNKFRSIMDRKGIPASLTFEDTVVHLCSKDGLFINKYAALPNG